VVTVDETAAGRKLIQDLYDAIGELEWLRLVHDPAARVAFEIHRRFLAKHVKRGQQILEIGAGPGRFTIALAELGCRVVVSDLSLVQLELNEQHLQEAGLDHAVRERRQLDVCDLTAYPDDTFDAVVAYGGPLSYLFGDEQRALRECLRVTRPGGVVLASVMSLAGSGRRFLDAFPPTIDAVGLDVFDQFLGHGDQRVIEAAPGVHPCQLFTWRQVQGLVVASGGSVLDSSASNWLSLGPTETVEYFEADPTRWNAFLDWEERLCAEPGAIDGGTHIIFAATPALASAR
jgi:SAM-dependent methyltransferase